MIDQRIIETMTELGVSDECVGESRADAEPNPAPAATDPTSQAISNTSTPTTKLKEDITMTTTTTTTTTTTRIIRRVGAGSLIAGTVLAAGAATAHADHVHSVQVGNGTCVLLAHDGGESEVDLPFADEALVDANRAHPIHLLVHLGRAGENFAIGVYGTASDPCYETGNYVND